MKKNIQNIPIKNKFCPKMDRKINKNVILLDVSYIKNKFYNKRKVIIINGDKNTIETRIENPLYIFKIQLEEEGWLGFENYIRKRFLKN